MLQNSSVSWKQKDEKIDNNKTIVNTSVINQNHKNNWFKFKTKLIWTNIIAIIALHLIFVYYIITFPYRSHKILVLWGIIVGHVSGLGVTGGVHRLWCHRTYKAKLPLRILLATFYTTAGMNRIHDWVRDHRLHHKFTETDADPHNSNRGFWFAHVGWLMMKKHPQVYVRGATLNMTDVLNDPVIHFFDKNFLLLKITLCFIMPVIIPVYFLNQDMKMAIITQIFIRYPIVLNSTWAVNSFAHMFGYRSYNKTIKSRENLGVALLALGEGWHNYHHIFPWDYKAAEFGHFIHNPTTIWIEFFAKIGWAYNLKQTSQKLINKTIKCKGDGSHLNLKNKNM